MHLQGQAGFMEHALPVRPAATCCSWQAKHASERAANRSSAPDPRTPHLELNGASIGADVWSTPRPGWVVLAEK